MPFDFSLRIDWIEFLCVYSLSKKEQGEKKNEREQNEKRERETAQVK